MFKVNGMSNLIEIRNWNDKTIIKIVCKHNHLLNKKSLFLDKK